MSRPSLASATGHSSSVSARKPKALRAGSRLAVFAPASPGNDAAEERGLAELARLGFSAERGSSTDTPVCAGVNRQQEGYFSASTDKRKEELISALADTRVDGLIALRGGYGSNYLLDPELSAAIATPKCLIGFSDITSLQIFLWQRCGWTSIYGPMVAAGLEAGAGAPKGYDQASFLNSIGVTDGAWQVSLEGEPIASGDAEGTLLGGCMTLVETTIGTPWELDTRDSILFLEDRGMKPWQVDRALIHLQQAGKFENVRGIMLGDFPDCEPPIAGSPTVLDVCVRILKPLGIPILFGAPVGHTARPMLTIPLGVRARLRAAGTGSLEILEAAVMP
jgi:muramoyltetrapeptide carboxypeptidase